MEQVINIKKESQPQPTPEPQPTPQPDPQPTPQPDPQPEPSPEPIPDPSPSPSPPHDDPAAPSAGGASAEGTEVEKKWWNNPTNKPLLIVGAVLVALVLLKR